MDDFYGIEQQIKEIREQHNTLKEHIMDFLRYPKKRNSLTKPREITFKIEKLVKRARKDSIKITQDIESDYS